MSHQPPTHKDQKSKPKDKQKDKQRQREKEKDKKKKRYIKKQIEQDSYQQQQDVIDKRKPRRIYNDDQIKKMSRAQRRIKNVYWQDKPQSKTQALKDRKKALGYEHQKIRFQDYSKQVQAAYKFAKDHNKKPEQIYDQIKAGNKEYTSPYNILRSYATKPRFFQKIKSAVAGKFVKQTADKLQVPMKQAACILLLDDFFDDVKSAVPQAFDKVKQYYSKNKNKVHKFITGAATRLHPAFGAIADLALTHFGGPMDSQDPYSVDKQYIKYVFGVGPPRPLGRFQTHYMYQMTARVQVPVRTLDDGTALVTICPLSCMAAPYVNPNFTQFPFVSVAAGNSTYMFASAPSYSPAGPFYTQKSSIQSYGVDMCSIDYMHTESLLNTKGKLQVGFFYQPPNVSFTPDQVNGQWTSASLNITDTQMITNLGYVKRWTNNQLTKLTRVGTLIPQMNKNQCLRMYNRQISTNPDLGAQLAQNGNWIFMKFTGCSPGAANIGTVFVTISISIQPTAAMRSILTVTPRGSYEGNFRVFKKARKAGIPLEFLSGFQAQPMFVQNSSQFNANKILSFGQGKVLQPKGFICTFSSKRSGFCVTDALQYLGIQNDLGPWATLQQATLFLKQLVVISDQKILYVKNKIIAGKQFVVFDLKQKHCWVGTSDRQLVSMDPIVSSNIRTLQGNWVFGQQNVSIYKTQGQVFKIQVYPLTMSQIPGQVIRILNAIGLYYNTVQQNFQYILNQQVKQYFQDQTYYGPQCIYKAKSGFHFFYDYSSKNVNVYNSISLYDFQKKLGILLDQFHKPIKTTKQISWILRDNRQAQAYKQIKLQTIQKNPGPKTMQRYTVSTLKKTKTISKGESISQQINQDQQQAPHTMNFSDHQSSPQPQSQPSCDFGCMCQDCGTRAQKRLFYQMIHTLQNQIQWDRDCIYYATPDIKCRSRTCTQFLATIAQFRNTYSRYRLLKQTIFGHIGLMRPVSCQCGGRHHPIQLQKQYQDVQQFIHRVTNSQKYDKGHQITPSAYIAQFCQTPVQNMVITNDHFDTLMSQLQYLGYAKQHFADWVKVQQYDYYMFAQASKPLPMLSRFRHFQQPQNQFQQLIMTVQGRRRRGQSVSPPPIQTQHIEQDLRGQYYENYIVNTDDEHLRQILLRTIQKNPGPDQQQQQRWNKIKFNIKTLIQHSSILKILGEYIRDIKLRTVQKNPGPISQLQQQQQQPPDQA